MKITKHAEMRMKQRNGLNKKACSRMAQKALECGISHAQTKGRLNKWMTSLYFANKEANNIRLYGDKAYIFCGEVLVTVLQIPNDLRKDIESMIKK